MSIAVATFVLCAAIIVGSYWAFVVRVEDKTARAVRKRLKPARLEAMQRAELTKKTPPLSAVRMLDALLVRSGALVEPVKQSIALSALPVTVGMVLLACALVGMVLFVILVQFTPAGLAALAALVAAPLPYVYVQVAARRRLQQLEEQFPQAVDFIATSLRAGHAFSTGLLMVAEEVPNPLGGEFRLMYDQQTYGKPLPDVLRELAQRVPSLDVRIFVTAVLTQRETGGNLAEVLDKLSALIRERFTLRRHVKTVSAHGRITGWVLVGLPLAVAGLISIIAPQHLTPLVDDPVGLQLTAGAVVLQIVGALAVRRIVNIEI